MNNLLSFGLKNIGTIQTLMNGAGMLKQFFGQSQNQFNPHMNYPNYQRPPYYNQPYHQYYQRPPYGYYQQPPHHQNFHPNNNWQGNNSLQGLLNLGNLFRNFKF